MNLAIETQDLGKHYGDVTAVEQLSLQVAEGEIYAFLGLNGAGKTTTIRMLLGMIKPTTGYARVLQTRVRLGSREPWESVGYMVEDPACLSGADRLREPGGRPPPAPRHPAQGGRPDHRAPGPGSLCRPAGRHAFPRQCPAPGVGQSPAP